MNGRFQAYAATMIFLLCIYSFANAQGGEASGSPGIKERALLPRGLFYLGLSNSQIESVKAIVDRDRESVDSIFKNRRVLESELDTAVNKDSADESAVREAAKNLAIVQEEFYVLKA